MNQTIQKDVMQLDPNDQKKWLEQRGYIPSERGGVLLFRHPETGVRYVFQQALKLAYQDCRLPADYLLAPEIKKHKPDETVTDAAPVNQPTDAAPATVPAGAAPKI